MCTHFLSQIIGADIIGLNCQYDPTICLKTIRLMKKGLDDTGLTAYLMLQPLGFHVPEVEKWKQGYHDLPEFPFGTFSLCYLALSKIGMETVLVELIYIYIFSSSGTSFNN